MKPVLNQRWRDGCDAYRPAGETIDVRRYDVALIPDDTTAKAFVLAHHYSGTFPAARFRVGLYRRDVLVGVAVFSVPCNAAALTNVFPCEPDAAAELGRFVLLDDVPGNGETWFLARCFEQLRRIGLEGILSFSDPMPRATPAGHVVFGGHVGTIYQAHNAVYLGRSTARTLRVLPDGSILSARAIAKVQAMAAGRDGSKSRGWEYVVAQLRAFGAPAVSSDLSGWMRAVVASTTRPVRHPGNHKYAWGLDRSMRRHLPVSDPFPKQPDVLAGRAA